MLLVDCLEDCLDRGILVVDRATNNDICKQNWILLDLAFRSTYFVIRFLGEKKISLSTYSVGSSFLPANV